MFVSEGVHLHNISTQGLGTKPLESLIHQFLDASCGESVNPFIKIIKRGIYVIMKNSKKI